MKIMKHFWLIGYFSIAIIYWFVAYLVSDYTTNDYRYWMSVLWCGIILSIMYLSVGTYQRKAREQNANTPLFIAFAVTTVTLGSISIAVCVRAYYFHPEWMQVVNVLTQGVISIYMIVRVVGFISVGSLENKSQQRSQKQRSYTAECKQLFTETRNIINSENIRLYSSVIELFNKTILIVKTDEHILRLNQIKNTLSVITQDSTTELQNKQLMQIIQQINNFYR